jgi:non-homologous end joining protein Ku
MAPPSLWSGNLRLSLVLIPVRLVPAVSTEEAISFGKSMSHPARPLGT